MQAQKEQIDLSADYISSSMNTHAAQTGAGWSKRFDFSRVKSLSHERPTFRQFVSGSL
ncbi:MAG: hypothetical protein BWY82_01645 [Verrucomicrobia bacterium ADurb.Bin474]|nr:MAG: hypothetical protein BWY82_01645 [Verrucomicrobia bacterium ADurb.Bin474]